MCELPEDLLISIWRTYFHHFVVKELYDNTRYIDQFHLPISVRLDWMNRTYIDVSL